ncbi:MAG: alpha/beta hydrolase [Chloroflexi bacterium]|nr:alpha/beta hydrolase [Chloroflexota bacterium]
MTSPTRTRGAKRLSSYELGRTPFFAARCDQRFSYCLYVPDNYDPAGTATYPLAVIVHGTRRTAQRYRDKFAAFGRAHDCIVLAPLFPCGIIEPGELNNYKHIKFYDIRFDLLLLAMIDEVAERYRVHAERFLLHGFSGGGQFAHRFFYLHPARLMGVSIGAPGTVTLLDPDRDWWCGIRDIEQQFDRSLDYDRLREVPVQTVIGANDTETWQITIRRESRLWMEGANDAGRTRRERLEALATSFERAGLRVRHDVVPGVGHNGLKVLEPVKAFFAETLASRCAGAAISGA